MGERLHLGRLRTMQRQLHLGLLGMLLHCEEPERAIAKGFCEGAVSSSSSLQQVQLACARSIFFLDQKSSSSSTATWEKWEVNQEGLTATCLCAPIIPLYPSTTFAVLRTSSQRCTLPQSAPNTNRGSAQRSQQFKDLLCCSSLSDYCLLLTVGVFCLLKHLNLIILISFNANQKGKSKSWTQSMQDGAPHCGFCVIKVYDLKGSFLCSPCRSVRETVAGVLFGYFARVGSHIREGN